jgi:hypothetical protein
VVFEDKNCTGIISADACRKGLSNMPGDKVKSICEKIRAQKGFKSFQTTCPVFAAFCPEEKKSAGCEKPPPPWLGPPPSDCKDVRKPEVDVVQTNQGTEVTVTLCGYTRFLTPPDPRTAKDFAANLASQIKSRIGSRICCEKFRDAVDTGIPCHPRMDLDCDGRPEDSLLEIKLFQQSANADVDPFPPGLDPDDTKFFPPREKCDCKWELVKGTLNCSPDGKQPHFYQARWKCASSGNEIFTRKEAPATAPCTKPRI